MEYKSEQPWALSKQNNIQSKTTIIEPVHEEWTKYYVNGLECDKEDIYQTILNKSFYNGPVTLDKKYHYSHEEKKITRDDGPFSQISQYISTDKQSNNKSSNFSLDTKKFIDKFKPESHEYKLLISNMIYTLDMFYEAIHNYKENVKDFHFAVRHCMGFYLENITDSPSPYDALLNAFFIENLTFIFDMMAFLSSWSDLNNAKTYKLPNLAFDTSSIKETWDAQWSNNKKSQYIKEFLSVMLNQTDVLHQRLNTHDVFKDTSLQSDIKGKFDAFKNTINDFKNKKNAIDNSQPDVSNPFQLSNITSFFYQGPTNGETSNNQPSPTEYLI